MTTASFMAITPCSGPALGFPPRDLLEQCCTHDLQFLQPHDVSGADLMFCSTRGWYTHTHTCACDHTLLPTRHLMEHFLVRAGCRGAENGTLLHHSSFTEAIMPIFVSAYCAITILSFVLVFFFKGHLIRSNKLVHQTEVLHQFINL